MKHMITYSKYIIVLIAIACSCLKNPSQNNSEQINHGNLENTFWESQQTDSVFYKSNDTSIIDTIKLVTFIKINFDSINIHRSMRIDTIFINNNIITNSNKTKRVFAYEHWKIIKDSIYIMYQDAPNNYSDIYQIAKQTNDSIYLNNNYSNIKLRKINKETFDTTFSILKN